MARVFARQRTWLDPVLRPVGAAASTGSTGVDETHEMRSTSTPVAVLMFSVVSLLMLYAIRATAHVLPLNPQGFGGAPATRRSTRPCRS